MTEHYIVIETVCTHCNGERAVPLVLAETDDFDTAIDIAEDDHVNYGSERFVVDTENRVVVWSKP